MKTSKRVISLVLSVIMIMTTFVVATPMLMANAVDAGDIEISGVTQTTIVKDTSVYDTYAANYLNGAGYSTGIVIPGLDASQDYVIQGMTYYPAKDWMLVTAYHNDGTASSKVFALDAATGEFVAMFSFINVDGSPNTDHGGGIAVSEHNIYYSCGDKDRKIAYAPVSELNVEKGTYKTIKLVAEADFVEVGSVSEREGIINVKYKNAYTAYVCYDQGILWMGNFYDMGAKFFGVTIAAADYSVPSNSTYNSMVFGYKLSGSNSTEEWNNLVSGTADCQGNPSYAIGLSNTLKDVQYAVVDNGKIYLSRSYGSGSGNSINFGFGETSYLTVADIDLSVPGDTPVKINTGSKEETIMAYDISDYDDYPMMPMSEGLCVIDGDIFITFEGASNKYLNESSGLTSIGNCEKPVDVIWQLDPYALMEIDVAEPEKSIHYEKIHSLSEIESGEEYLILHESPDKDLITQKNILYALNADGNFKDYKLSKSSVTEVKGYNGMIGHAITEYDIVDSDDDGVNDFLYLNNPDNDDVENVRWTLTNVSGNNYRIASTEPYFANCNNLYFDDDQISMMPSGSGLLNNIKLQESGNGKGGFWLSNDNYFLWSNDGKYNDKIKDYYSRNSGTTPIYGGISEQKGTFHCDALNKTGLNIIGGSVPADNSYADRVFYIYKRIVDDVASTYESRVYTNLGAELQEDGTYTVELETYAISPNHYQYRGIKPTDYIIVADTSNSMEHTGSTGVKEFNDKLSVASLSAESATSDDNGKGVNGYNFSNADEDIYYKHTDGNYYKVYLAVNTTEKKIGKCVQSYWAYYIADDGLYYVLNGTGVNSGIDGKTFKSNVDSNKDYSTNINDRNNKDRRKTIVYNGPHYRFDDVNSKYAEEHIRISTLKNALSNLVGQIAAENSENRIALVQFGADASTGFYNTSSTLSTTDYANAFWSVSNASSLQSIINGITTSTQTSNDGIEFKYVNEIIAKSGVNYKGGDSKRNVAVIFLSDGVAGADDQKYTETAANKVIARALDAKRSGAFVYTVMLGADGTDFNRKLYMDAVSSRYAEAASMTDLGGQNVDGITYALSLATTTMDNYINFGHVALEEISTNNAVGLESLDANAYLREQFSEAFKFPTESTYDVKVELVPGVFDKIGRFNFNESARVKQDKNKDGDVKWEVAPDDRTITVTNYNYAEQYIGRNRTTPGNKLRITITGLLANEDAKIQNTSINDITTTGIYKSGTIMNDPNGVAFKYLPTEYFNIPEYTYVLDYGLPMYDSEVNGTLKSVSKDLSAQRDANGNLAYKTESGNGLVEIAGNSLDLIYRSTPTNFADSGYCLIQRDDGTYDWFEIKVVPASNVLFEEDYMNNSGTGVSWTKDGTTKKGYQTPTNELTDVYGYDGAYADSANGHSYGSADKATVSATAKRSVTKTFEFRGDGIDLISACGPNTGIMIVKISGEDLEKPKAYIVDTYYGDSAVKGLVCQTPIVNFRGNHGTYTVEATAVYLSSAGAVTKSVTGTTSKGKLEATTGVPVSEADTKALLAELGMADLANADLELVWFDDNSVLNGGTGAKGNVKTARDGSTVTSLDCYLDGFRIYHPMKTANDDYIANEKQAQYINVLDSINKNQISSGSTELHKIAYVTGDLKADENGVIPSLSFANYQNVGPQNELYLAGDKTATDEALVLQVSLPAPTSRVHLGLRAVTGTATVMIGATEFEINSATEMYYDVTDCLSVEGAIATITIQNTGSNLVAVNNIKLTGDATAIDLEESALEKAALSMAADPIEATVVNGVVTPVVEDTDTDTDVGTDTDTDGDTGSSNLSFIEQIIAKIMEFLSSIFQFLPVGEVA